MVVMNIPAKTTAEHNMLQIDVNARDETKDILSKIVVLKLFLLREGQGRGFKLVFLADQVRILWSGKNRNKLRRFESEL